MYAMTRSPSSQTMSLAGIYKMPPPGPVPPPGPPAPLPNLALFGQAESIFDKLSIVGLPACIMPGKITLSAGDEVSAGGPGGGGGLISGKIKGPAQATGASGKFFAGGKPVVRMTDSSMHDDNNGPGNTVAPSQTKVMVAS